MARRRGDQDRFALKQPRRNRGAAKVEKIAPRYGEDGEHDPANGLLLQTNIRRLFDLGYVTVSDDHRFEVSQRLRTDFDNSRHYHYYDLHGMTVRPAQRGKTLHMPERLVDRPDRDQLTVRFERYEAAN